MIGVGDIIHDADPNVPIYRQIENVLLERVKFLKSEIEKFNSPITEIDYKDNFKSRLSGDKSTRALRKYYDELLLREEELGLIRSFEWHYQRNIRFKKGEKND